MVYPSKRDTWIVVMIWSGVVVSAYGGLVQVSGTAPLAVRIGTLILLLAVDGFVLWVLYGTYYILTDKDLLIRCGPLRYRVPLGEIELVQPSRNPLSSPACSLDRLLITWRGARKRVLISPAQKVDFLRNLERKCPELKRDGDRLVRST